MSSEQEEFNAAFAEFTECGGVMDGGGGCACMGGCLGNALAKIRKKYDGDYEGDENWWSDQLHGALKKRKGDSGRPGAAINAENYWSGVQ